MLIKQDNIHAVLIKQDNIHAVLIKQDNIHAMLIKQDTLSCRTCKVVASHAAVARSIPAEVALIYTMH